MQGGAVPAPLFATGAIQILAERGDIGRANGAWKLNRPLAQLEVDVPASVRSMIEKKVGLLSEEERQTALCASIFRRHFGPMLNELAIKR